MEYSVRYYKAAEKYLDTQTRDAGESIIDIVAIGPRGDVYK